MLARNPNIFYGMGLVRKRRVKRRRHAHGAGFFDALKSAHDWIKSNKVISNVANALGSVGVPYANQIASVSSKLGYGRKPKTLRQRRPAGGRRRVVRHRRRHGAGFLDALKSAHNFIKSNKIISTVGNALAKSNVPYAGKVAEVAGRLGYGRVRKSRRRRRRVVRHHGGANFFSTEQIARPRF